MATIATELSTYDYRHLRPTVESSVKAIIFSNIVSSAKASAGRHIPVDQCVCATSLAVHLSF